MPFSVIQSVPICLALAASGGAIEVLATAVLAYQDAREKEGHHQSVFMRYVGLSLNIVLQLSSSVVGHLFAPWFGPVSLVGPVFLSSQLLVNLLVFGCLLGLEMFTKDMQIGTYIVVIAVIMLPIVGPAAQDDQDIATLLKTWYALIWSTVLLVGMTISSILVVVLNVSKLQERGAILLLLLARATTFAVNLTASKVMIMKTNRFVFATAVILKVTSGAMQTYAIVVQSTAVTQAKFVPLNASALIIVNALTGMIIWEDWRVVGSWVGYVCVFVQLVLGNYLLLGDVEMLSAENTHYGRAKSIMMLDHLQDWNASSLYDIDESDSSDDDDVDGRGTEKNALAIQTALLDSTTNGTYLSINGNETEENTTGRGRRAPRRPSTAVDAWKSIYGLNGQHVPSRRHSVFHIDATRDFAADLSL